MRALVEEELAFRVCSLHRVFVSCSAELSMLLVLLPRLTVVVSCCSMYKEAIAARSQAARVLMSKSHLPPR